MKMDSNALKFDPQVMALAMPQESGFTKLGEGISNVGKVFLDADARKEASALNALKMEEANQSIIGKTNENLVFAEEQTRKADTHRETQRKAKLDFDMLDRKNKGEIKSLEESGVLDKLSGQIKTPDFFDGKAINLEGFNASRTETLKDPRMAGKEHIVNAMYDKKFKELNDLLEGTLKNGKTAAEIKNKDAETSVVVPKANAYIATQGSVITKNNAGAALDNVNASLAPIKAKAYVDQSKAASANAGTKGRDHTKEREKIIADGKITSMIPDENFEAMTGKQKLEIGKLFVQTGVLPKEIKEISGGQYQAIYPAGSLPKAAVSVPAAKAAAKPAQKYDYTKYMK